MNNLQKLDLQLKNRFLGIKTELCGPIIAPDNTNYWVLNIENFTSKEIIFCIDWYESTDDFGITTLNEDIGYGWHAPHEMCDTIEKVLSKSMELIIKFK